MINDNTALRTKHANFDYSQGFKDAVISNPKPVVFAGGVFSDLIRWGQSSSFGFSKGVATQLGVEGRDARGI